MKAQKDDRMGKRELKKLPSSQFVSDPRSYNGQHSPSKVVSVYPSQSSLADKTVLEYHNREFLRYNDGSKGVQIMREFAPQDLGVFEKLFKKVQTMHKEFNFLPSAKFLALHLSKKFIAWKMNVEKTGSLKEEVEVASRLCLYIASKLRQHIVYSRRLADYQERDGKATFLIFSEKIRDLVFEEKGNRDC